MSAASCPTCGANVPEGVSTCPECGAATAGPDGVETRLRRYWSAPDLGLLAGTALAGVGILLVAFQVWLWGVLALVLAAAILVLRWQAGRRETGVALGALGTRLTAHRRVVRARSRGQLELFRERRELAELQSERDAGYLELGRTTHGNDEAGAEAASEKLDDVGVRIAAKEAEIGVLVGAMKERVKQAQARAAPAGRTEAPPEPARVPEPFPPPDEGSPPEPARVPEPYPQPVPEPAPDDPVPAPGHPPAPETARGKPSGAPNT